VWALCGWAAAAMGKKHTLPVGVQSGLDATTLPEVALLPLLLPSNLPYWSLLCLLHLHC
jgi:hypothetical protein